MARIAARIEAFPIGESYDDSAWQAEKCAQEMRAEGLEVFVTEEQDTAEESTLWVRGFRKEHELPVFLVGRHAPDFGEQPVKVVGQEAVTWPVAASLCIPEMHRLEQLARERGAQAIVLQNVPVQVAGAIATIAYLSPGGHQGMAWYGIVTLPGERPGNVTKTLSVPSSSTDALKKFISFANPRAKVTVGGDASVPDDEGYVGFDPAFIVITVEVDGPPMPFKFSHLEPLL